jgi:hypothetical protein
MELIKTNLREHFFLMAVCFLYFIAVFAIDLLTNSKIMGDLNFYYFIINQFIFSFLVLFFSIKLISFIVVNVQSGLSCLPKFFHDLKRDYLTADALLRFGIVYLLVPPFMCSYSSMKQAIPVFKKFDSDILLSRLDHLIHFNNNPWTLLQSLIGNPSLTRLIDFCYIAWGSIFLYTLLWMAYSRRKLLRIRFLLTLVFCWVIIGNILAALLASVGPCYYGHVTASAVNPYAPMLDYLHSIPTLEAVRIQEALWKAYINGTFMPLGGISAMPSMHVSIAVLLALVYRKVSPWLGFIFVLYAGVIQIGSVHLGWHYAIDGYLSAILTVTIWKAVSYLLPTKEGHYPPLRFGTPFKKVKQIDAEN